MRKNVLVVGAGPVGLITALLLARQGVEVRVIDVNAGVVDSPKALSYAWSVLDALEVHGLLDAFLEEGFPIYNRGWHIFRTDEWIIHNVDSLKGFAYHPYTLTLGQNRLSEIVLRFLKRQPTVRIDWSTKFLGLEQAADKVTATVEDANGTQTIEAGWLIGCDGGRSAVRKALGFQFGGVTWPRRFVATNMYHAGLTEADPPAGYLVDPVYGAVITKINQDNLWRVTFSEDESIPLEGTRERINAFARKALPGGGDYELTLYSSYSMHQRTAPTYRQGRVLLAGDAAHITNPTSGFGLMGGMYDSFCLGEALGAVLVDNHDDQILDRYAQERRNVFLGVTSPVSAESMRVVFYCDDPIRLEHDLITLRHRGTDPKLMRQSLMTPAALETPSLITGQTFVDRLRSRGRTPPPA